VSEIGEEEECKGCRILQDSLNYEREQKEYFAKLLMTKFGIIHTESEVEDDMESYPSIRHSTTLSMLRKMAATASRRKSEESKEAREKFEAAVGNR
jgi:hypothetical protein